MNLYQQPGYLILGSRLRRIGDAFLSEVTLAYQAEGIEFEASWFPVFYLLAQREELSIKELSEKLGTSHPAASQLIKGLKGRCLVCTAPSKTDGRIQLVSFTAEGRKLLKQVQPVWAAISGAMLDLVNSQPGCDQLLPAICAFETAMQAGLAEKISDKLLERLNTAHHE